MINSSFIHYLLSMQQILQKSANDYEENQVHEGDEINKEPFECSYLPCEEVIILLCFKLAADFES